MAFDVTETEAAEESAIDAHFEQWPEGCPDGCRHCASRLRDRCGDVDGHMWPATFDYGDTCYCGALYLLRDPGGRVRVTTAPTST
jgi:hypothetical protein